MGQEYGLLKWQDSLGGIFLLKKVISVNTFLSFHLFVEYQRERGHSEHGSLGQTCFRKP